MTIKTTPPVSVLYFSTRTTLSQLQQFVGTVAKDLYADAVRHNLLPSGPLLWNYQGADGKPDTEFSLEIALPVSGDNTSGTTFPRKELPPFDCISATHTGPWNLLYETYDRLFDDAFARGKKPTGFCREQYILMDFLTPANNITEVQLGIEK